MLEGMRTVLVLSSLVVLVPACLAAADERGQSASAPLFVSATVVSSCAVATGQGQVAFKCTRGALSAATESNPTVPATMQAVASPARTTVTASLVTIDF